MLILSPFLPLLALAAAADPADTPERALPTAAVFSLEATSGMDAAVARALTENLVDAVRRSHAFSRVSSAQDLEAVLGLERQRQLLNCTESSCMAELAGALGVDFLLVGSLARLGGSYLFNARLVNTRTALAASSVSLRVKGENEEALLDVVKPAVRQLLEEAALVPKTVAVPAPASAPAVPQKSTRQIESPAPETARSGVPVKRMALLGAGAAGMALSLPMVLASVAVLGGAGAIQVLWRMGSLVDIIRNVSYEQRLLGFYSSLAAEIALAAVLGAGALALLVVGGAAAAGGVLAGRGE